MLVPRLGLHGPLFEDAHPVVADPLNQGGPLDEWVLSEEVIEVRLLDLVLVAADPTVRC